jgi:hypothetical protein
VERLLQSIGTGADDVNFLEGILSPRSPRTPRLSSNGHEAKDETKAQYSHLPIIQSTFVDEDEDSDWLKRVPEEQMKEDIEVHTNNEDSAVKVQTLKEESPMKAQILKETPMKIQTVKEETAIKVPVIKGEGSVPSSPRELEPSKELHKRHLSLSNIEIRPPEPEISVNKETNSQQHQFVRSSSTSSLFDNKTDDSSNLGGDIPLYTEQEVEKLRYQIIKQVLLRCFIPKL